MGDLKEMDTQQIDDAGPEIVVPKSKLDSLTIPQALKVYRKASLICALAAFSAMCDGYQVNLNGSIIVNKGFIKQFGTVKSSAGVLSLNAQYVSVWGGMQSVGQVIGMTTLNFLSDKAGRKKTLYAIWICMVASVLAESLAKTWWAWLIAKILAGMGVGGMQATLPVYISEIAPTQLRGALINAYSAWFVVGQLVAPIVLQQNNLKTPYEYKTPIYSQWAMIGAIIAFWWFLPESPWWLASAGKYEEGKAVLHKINGQIEGYSVEDEFNVMLSTIEEERRESELQKTQSFVQIFKGTNGWRTLIACWPKCMQQLTGLSLVNSYATYFFSLAGNKDPFKVTVILACVQVASIILVSMYTDVARRLSTVCGFGIAAVSVLAIGIVGCFNYTSKSLGSLLIFLACSAIFFNTAAGAIGYCYLAEVPTQKWRARTAGFGAAMAASLGVCFSFSVPIMLKGAPHWGVRTGFFFGATGIPATILAFFILPETARRSTAELDEMFLKKVPPRRFSSYKTDVEKSWAEQQAGKQVA
ncbi:general substrate transporter [Meredithblackwellia eburnea MCA 4105]